MPPYSCFSPSTLYFTIETIMGNAKNPLIIQFCLLFIFSKMGWRIFSAVIIMIRGHSFLESELDNGPSVPTSNFSLNSFMFFYHFLKDSLYFVVQLYIVSTPGILLIIKIILTSFITITVISHVSIYFLYIFF